MSPDEAKRLIIRGRAPENLHIDGALSLEGSERLTELPNGLQATSLNLRGCTALTSLPQGLQVARLDADACENLRLLPPGLRFYELNLTGTAIESLPDDIQVDYKLDLSLCRKLAALPRGLKASSLVLCKCTGLRALPEGLDVCFLDIEGCSQIASWPTEANIRIGRLSMRGCTKLTTLPRGLRRISQLDVRDCVGIQELPEGLEVTSWIDVANSGLSRLPDSMRNVRIRWGRVLIDGRIAFHPETLTVEEILAERNAERRRVMLEQFGFDRFMREAAAEVIDEDQDAGGPRQLLHVPLEDDEDLVCISVRCPSTDRHYMIRVPPDMRTCHQAVAWTAGFDNPDDYRPLVET